MSPAESPTCPLCGGADALALGVCLPCAGAAGDGLVFAHRRRGAPAADGSETEMLARIAVDGTTDALREAALGHRALAAVPLGATERVEGAFGRFGMPARVRSRRGPLPLPPGLGAFLVVVAGLGLTAGLTGSTMMLVTSPLFAGVLWVLAQVKLRTPLLDVSGGRSPLPSEVEAEVVRCLTALAPRVARDLYSDTVRLARLLHERARDSGESEALDDLPVLLVLAARAAVDLDRVERMQEVLLGAATGDGSGGDVAAGPSRDRLHRHLVDALRVMANANRRIRGAEDEAGELSALARNIDERLGDAAEARAVVESLAPSA